MYYLFKFTIYYLWPSNSIHRCMYRRISPMCARVTYRNVSHISVRNSKCVKTRYLSLNPRNKLTMISKGIITFEYLRYLYILKATQFWHIHIISLFNVCTYRINPKLRYRIKYYNDFLLFKGRIYSFNRTFMAVNTVIHCMQVTWLIQYSQTKYPAAVNMNEVDLTIWKDLQDMEVH